MIDEMKISFDLPESNLVLTHGYGVATCGVMQSLEKLGHTVAIHDAKAPVEISFTQPYNWQWSNPDAYHIGYVPWESTRLPEGWSEKMKEADEVWTTSPWCKTMFEKNGLENVRVYQHGIDQSVWQRKRRRPQDREEGLRQIRFLHVGEPAPRKGGQLVFDTFTDLFEDRDDVLLTIKAHGYNTVRGPNSKNVRLITEEFETFRMIDLFNRQDVLVYPSTGEGFGLIPLQAMVMGMPVICTDNWAPYKHLLLPELRVPGRLTPSPWPEMHPGNVYEPSAEGLRAAMERAADPLEYQSLSARVYYNSFQVEQEYDWITLTANAWAHIFEKFS